MRIKLLIFLLFLLGINLFSNNFSRFNLSINYEPTSLINGEQKTIMDDALTPQPDNYTSGTFSTNFQLYLFPNFGLELNYLFLGETKAINKEVNEPLGVYKHNVFELGGIVRYNRSLSNDNYFSLLLSGGFTYSILEYSDDFKDLFSFYDFYDVDPGWGWYSKLGANFNFNKYIYVGVSFKLYYLTNMIRTVDTKIDGYYICLPLYFGISM